MPLTVLSLDGARLGEPVEGADAGGEVVERGEVLEIAAVAAEQDLTQVDQAVDGLLDGGEVPRRRPLPMFHLAVVLEEADVVGRGLDAQHAAELVVHLDRGTAEAMLDAGPLDAGGELRADLLGQLRGDLAAEEAGDLLRLDAQHRLAGELFVERPQRRRERNTRSVAYSTCIRLQW